VNDVVLFAQPVEGMPLRFFEEVAWDLMKDVSELGTVVGLYHADLEGKPTDDGIEKIAAVGGAQFLVKAKDSQSCGAVDGGVLVALSAFDFVGHVFDVDLDQLAGEFDDMLSLGFLFGVLPLSGQTVTLEDAANGALAGHSTAALAQHLIADTFRSQSGPSADASRGTFAINERIGIEPTLLITLPPFVVRLTANAETLASQRDIADLCSFTKQRFSLGNLFLGK